MIYTANTIESFNSALRKVTYHKAAFSNEMSVLKILYLRTLDIVSKWTMPYPNWSIIRGKLDILWGDGWDR
jgi:transposase-like protein